MLKMFMWVLWPSFLVAIVAVGVFFSVFDPKDLPWPSGAGLPSSQAAHTIGFFFFWAIGALACAFTLILSRLAEENASLEGRETSGGPAKPAR